MVAARNPRLERFVWLHAQMTLSEVRSYPPPARSVPTVFKSRSTSALPFLGRRESLKIEGLDLKERHLLAVVDAHGKAIESLWFRVTTYNSKHLCMSYDGYQGIGLDVDGRHCPWCRCKYTD